MSSVDRSNVIPQETLRGLHPSAIDSPDAIHSLLRRAQLDGIQLFRGLNHRLDLETARIQGITREEMVLETDGFLKNVRRQVFLNFDVDGRQYFFAARELSRSTPSTLTIAIPHAIYSTERRDRARRIIGDHEPSITLRSGQGVSVEGRIEDISPGGLGVSVPKSAWSSEWRTVNLSYPGKTSIELPRRGWIKRVSRPDDNGWIRVGLVSSSAPPRELLEAEKWETTSDGRPEAIDGRMFSRPERDAHPAEFVELKDRDGRPIAGLLDEGDAPGDPTAVVMHTGWGETKESLMPLARTIVETFAGHNEPITVLRIDGVNQKGESYKDVDCRAPGREYNRFVFSQPIRDIEAAVRHLATTRSPKRTILISQSIAALSGRKFIARDQAETVDGWICLVGTPDLQSANRSISGGVDFAVGCEAGLHFGYQELLGVKVHIDRIMEDASENQLLYIQDAREDFSKIQIPVTWFLGRHDAWVDIGRVQDALSHGDQSARRLITLPITHRLGWSRSARTVFQTVASETARLAMGKMLAPVAPDPLDLTWRSGWEKSRRPSSAADLRKFWKDYLLGRDESIGIELMTSCEPYNELMATQIELLQPHSGDKILDLGCGTGSLSRSLISYLDAKTEISIYGVDHIQPALRKARLRTLESVGAKNLSATWLAADLEVINGGLAIPFADDSFDSILASLVLSYVEKPEELLREVLRVAKPGARVVISSLIRDADISRLYVESLAELSVTDATSQIPEIAEVSLDEAARNFLNDAARILELETEGAFAFWEPDELRELLKKAGFVSVTSRTTFGRPEQAVVVAGKKPA